MSYSIPKRLMICPIYVRPMAGSQLFSKRARQVMQLNRIERPKLLLLGAILGLCSIASHRTAAAQRANQTAGRIGQRPAPGGPAVGTIAPDINLTTANDRRAIRLRQLVDKPTV